jgi:adenosylmethionine-8-amino-7-oxononanoate aminotransferase
MGTLTPLILLPAALASLDLLLKDSCLENIRRISQQHQAFALQLQTNPHLENVRCTGTILAFDVKTEEETSYFNNSRNSLYEFFLNEGIILRPLGNTLYILPPYCISNEDLDDIYKAIEKRFAATYLDLKK